MARRCGWQRRVLVRDVPERLLLLRFLWRCQVLVLRCPHPCYGVKCPDVSKCAVQNGAAVCKCPAPFKRLINNQCSSAALANSDYLDQHNAARAAVGAAPLVWDDALASRARAWVQALASSAHNCQLQHGGASGEGQNLSGASPSGWASNGDAVRWWVDEGKWYQLGVFPNGCAGGDWAKCGHYTQLVWNNTRRLGCAKASCGTRSDVWACHYSPPGNYNGQLPYGTHCNGQLPYGTHCNGQLPYGTHCNGQLPYGTHCNSQLPYGTHCNGQLPYGTHCNGQLPYGTHCNGQLPYALAFSACMLPLAVSSSWSPPTHTLPCFPFPSTPCVPTAVQDPCFRALCPSTATCMAVGGNPKCQCAQGQALVNGKCHADPCRGASRCAGDLVCDGSSGAAQCVCPQGTVLTASNTCLASSTTVTTSIALFNRPSFTNAPATFGPIILRAPTPGAARPAGCVNVPAPMAGAVGSLKILWDAPDGATGRRVVCGLMWFWNGADCYGRAAGWYRPGNNVTTAATTSGEVALLRSISCSP
ncbi:unnamed protein product [Closterium sp. NIES-64]|nr:unnamed protein product [Closterium sp. NIES-64]